MDRWEATPTRDDLPRRKGDFGTLVEALEYAAQGQRGINFYSARGELTEPLPYAVLAERARRLGERLAGAGFKAGERIALIASTDSDFVTSFLACQYAGVLPVPLPLPTSFGGRDGYVGQLRAQLESCKASGLFSPASMADLLGEASEGLSLRVCGPFDVMQASGLPRGELNLPRAEDLAYLQYSSGSTRFPHGIAITHHALMSNCAGQGGGAMDLRDDDRNISWLPFYHDMGLVGMLLTPIANQVSADYMATEDFARRPLQWISLMSRNRGTITYSPTFGYDICARRVSDGMLEEIDISAWRVAGIGGDMIRPDVIRGFAETFAPAGFSPRAFTPSYGLAECTLAVTISETGRGLEVELVDEDLLSGEASVRLNGHSDGHAANGAAVDAPAGLNGHVHVNGTHGPRRTREIVNCGRPLPGIEIEIRGPGDRVLPPREIGRVFVRGDSVMTGYFGDPEATAAVLSDDGWLDTGDMGYLSGGCLFVIGRAKDMIIVNGRNHWPQDIEWAAEQLPGIRNGDIAAVSLPGADDAEMPSVLVHCRAREEADRRAFADAVRKQIYKVTGIRCQIELVPPRSLPRTSSGKLSRSKARQKFLSGDIEPLAY